MPTENRVRYCAIILLILFASMASFWAFCPFQIAFPVTFSGVLLFFLAIRVFLPARSLIALRFGTLTLLCTSVANMLLGNKLLAWFISVLSENYPWLKLPIISTSDTAGYVCIGVSLVAFVATLIKKDESAMGCHPAPLPDPLEEKDYREYVEGFCRCLERDLNNLDKDTEWSDQRFVPLQATVEIRSRKTSARSISDLLQALRKNHTQRYFLLLGDPGSGKSVTLRKLARDLLSEVRRTRRIPVYVNLKDWQTPIEWSRENIPLQAVVSKNLSEWIRQDLRRRLDSYGEQFLSQYFDLMMKGGHFFFILDSFDEITVLLDVPEQHELVRIVSQGIAQFLGGMHHSRGVLASRLFRKPTIEFDAPCELEIRPLSDDRIERLARKRFAEAGFSARLFAERPDLVAAARNPFTAALLVEYLDHNRNHAKAASNLPENRGGLFDHYLRRRLNQCRSQMERPDLSADDLLGVLAKIANLMCEAKSFEISSLDIPTLFIGISVSDIIDGLAKSRLLRISSGSKRTISFTHRRFAEYFIAKRWIDQVIPLPLEDIPTDSLWRDTLVLYCEIAPHTQVLNIASYCVRELQANLLNDPPKSGEIWLRTLHTLRFFSEAFRSRTSALKQWENELLLSVYKLIGKGDYLLAKWAIEMAAALPIEQYSQIVSKTLERRSPWLLETIFRQTDRLAHLPNSTVYELRHYFESLPFRQVCRQHSELSFALKLHSNLTSLRIHLNAVLIDSITWPSLVFLDMFVNRTFSSLYLYCMLRYIESSQLFKRGYVATSAMQQRTGIAIAFIPLYLMLFLFSKASFSLASLITIFSCASWPGLISRLYFFVWGQTWTLNSKVWLPSTWITSIYHSIVSNWKGAADGVIIIVGIALPFYLGWQAFHQQTWGLRIIFGILPLALFLILARAFIKFVLPAFWSAFKASIVDAIKLHRMQKAGLPRSRIELFSHWSELKTQWSKLVFVRRLESLQEISGDWPDVPPYASDGLAESKIARLEERWRRLNR